MDALVAESWREERRGVREEVPELAWALRMSRVTRDGTVELVSRDQIIRSERGRGKNISSV